MTTDQAKVVATAKRLAKEYGRRPTAVELWQRGVAFGRRQAFQTIQAIYEAADLALPAPNGHAGLTPAEERVFLHLWNAGSTRKEIGIALGLSVHVVSAEVLTRGLIRSCAVKAEQGDPTMGQVKRRCHATGCGQLTKGIGPCQHCGAPGLIHAA